MEQIVCCTKETFQPHGLNKLSKELQFFMQMLKPLHHWHILKYKLKYIKGLSSTKDFIFHMENLDFKWC